MRLQEIEQLTNLSSASELGNLCLLRLEDIIARPGTTLVMAASRMRTGGDSTTAASGCIMPPIPRKRRFAETVYRSQRYGLSRYQSSANGILFRGARDHAGECAAMFRPNLVRHCIPTKYLQYNWDGRSIADVLRVESLTGKF